MRCLEKNPADRWQNTGDILAQLEAIATPSGGTAAITGLSLASVPPARRLLTTGGLFLATSLVVTGVVWLLQRFLGLPDWVLPGAIALLAVGLPIVLTTAWVQGRQAAGRGASGEEAHWLTWRRAVGGGIAAFGALGIGTAAYMVMRLLGIGPVGTLVASGKLNERARVLIVDFTNRTADSLLGDAVTQAFRVDFAQSKLVSPVQPDYVRQVLARMGKGTVARLDLALGREVAEREGLKAVVSGEIAPAGGRFVVSTQLVEPTSGEVLAAFRETASDSSAILAAVDQVSKKLREKIGESLQSTRANAPLAQVTTNSLDALRKYSQALRVADGGDEGRASNLLEEAIAADTGFAMAQRKLGVLLTNQRIDADRARKLITQSFERRARLTDRERYLAEGSYYNQVLGDNEKAAAAYRSLLDAYPDDTWALTNLGVTYGEQGEYTRAAEMYARSIKLEPSDAISGGNLVFAWANAGQVDSAKAALEGMKRRLPGHPATLEHVFVLANSTFQFDEAERAGKEALAKPNSSLGARSSAYGALYNAATAVGHLADAARYQEEQYAIDQRRGVKANNLNQLLRAAELELVVRRRPDEATRLLDAALRTIPLDSLAAGDRPYARLAMLEAKLGRGERAKRWVAEFERTLPVPVSRDDRIALARIKAMMRGLVDHQPLEAAAEIPREWAVSCRFCFDLDRGELFDEAGQRDSALSAYQEYAARPAVGRAGSDRLFLQQAYTRLGELYEWKGDKPKALESYGKLVHLWSRADAELQPRVADIKRRMAKLAGEAPR